MTSIAPNSQYNSAQPYTAGQMVLVGNVVYQAIINVPPNEAPPNGTYWVVVPIAQAPLGGLFHFAFPFDHTTPGLAAGVDVGLSLNFGDEILDAWFEATVAFNGTTPYADWGTFSSTVGIMGELGTVAHLATADTVPTDNAGLLLPAAIKDVQRNAPLAPIKVTVNNTRILVVVSQTGAKGGSASGATAGSAVFHMVVAPNAAP